MADTATMTLEEAEMDSETNLEVAIAVIATHTANHFFSPHHVVLDVNLCRGLTVYIALMCNQEAEVEDMEVEMATTMALEVMVCDLFMVEDIFFSPHWF